MAKNNLNRTTQYSKSPFNTSISLYHDQQANKFSVTDISAFKKLIETSPLDEDTQLSSPAYLIHTCRKGMRVFKDRNLFITIGIHPNVPNRLIVFPQPGLIDPDFIFNICQHLQIPSGGIQLCRVKRQHASLFEKDPRFEKIEETVLDWRYPCAFLSSDYLINAAGPALAKFRQGFRRFDPSLVKIINVTEEPCESEFLALIQNWAKSVSKQKNFSEENLIEPNKSGYDLCFDPHLDVRGYMVLYNEKPLGFFTFELPVKSGVLNTLTFCIDRGVVGASELLHHLQALEAAKHGAKLLNINGTETETLHRFRKKLNPVKLLDIDSYEIKAATL